METVKVDNKKRVRLPDARPGQVFAYELSGQVMTLTPVKAIENDVPVVKMVKDPETGLYHFPESVKISREEIRAAIKADRERK